MKCNLRRRGLTAGLLCVSLTLSLALAACGNGDSPATGSPAPSPSAQASSGVSQGISPSQAAQPVLQPGTWLSDGGQYYFFDADGASGRVSSLEDGTGTGFTYRADGGQAVFSLGGADGERSCDITVQGDSATLQWEDGSTEQLTFVSSQGSDQFQFYSNQALCQMALEHYKQGKDAQDTDGLMAAAQTNPDGTVTIQVYQNLGDHNSTAAWYTVDRLTAQGTDGTGASVDLNA